MYARAFLALGFIQSLVIMCLMWTILLTHGLLLVSSSLVSGSVAVSLRDGLSQGRMKPVHVQGEEGGGKKPSVSPVQRRRRVLTGLTFIDCWSFSFFPPHSLSLSLSLNTKLFIFFFSTLFFFSLAPGQRFKLNCSGCSTNWSPMCQQKPP